MPSALRDAPDTARQPEDWTPDEEGGITAWANQVWVNSDQARSVGQEEVNEGVYVFSREETQARERTGGELFTAPDGYIRRSPVQKLVIPEDYYRKRTRKIILIACGVILAIVALNLLFQFGVIRF